MFRFFSLIFLFGFLIQTTFGADDELKIKQSKAADAIAKIPAAKVKLFFYSIDPNNISDVNGKLKMDSKHFHGYNILGEIEVVSFQEKTNLLQSFSEGVREGARGMYCFNPRHALRVVEGATTNDFRICFECHQVVADGFGSNSDFLVSSSPAETFNNILDKHKIKKAE